jgi:hypothetical protein
MSSRDSSPEPEFRFTPSFTVPPFNPFSSGSDPLRDGLSFNQAMLLGAGYSIGKSLLDSWQNYRESQYKHERDESERARREAEHAQREAERRAAEERRLREL